MAAPRSCQMEAVPRSDIMMQVCAAVAGSAGPLPGAACAAGPALAAALGQPASAPDPRPGPARGFPGARRPRGPKELCIGLGLG
jgi:hypothetical protein